MGFVRVGWSEGYPCLTFFYAVKKFIWRQTYKNIIPLFTNCWLVIVGWCLLNVFYSGMKTRTREECSVISICWRFLAVRSRPEVLLTAGELLTKRGQKRLLVLIYTRSKGEITSVAIGYSTWKWEITPLDLCHCVVRFATDLLFGHQKLDVCTIKLILNSLLHSLCFSFIEKNVLNTQPGDG